MRMPKSVTQQSAQLPPELVEERKAVRALFRVFDKPQSDEYVAAAKAFNAKLRAAGLTALLVVEG
jgi:preprotein translocase subunit Sss1